jgi:hypothetical protein
MDSIPIECWVLIFELLTTECVLHLVFVSKFFKVLLSRIPEYYQIQAYLLQKPHRSAYIDENVYNKNRDEIFCHHLTGAVKLPGLREKSNFRMVIFMLTNNNPEGMRTRLRKIFNVAVLTSLPIAQTFYQYCKCPMSLFISWETIDKLDSSEKIKWLADNALFPTHARCLSDVGKSITRYVLYIDQIYTFLMYMHECSKGYKIEFICTYWINIAKAFSELHTTTPDPDVFEIIRSRDISLINLCNRLMPDVFKKYLSLHLISSRSLPQPPKSLIDGLRFLHDI